MPAAEIQINGTPGSDVALTIATLVTLSNNNVGGEVSYLWAIADQPPGAADALSATTVAAPTFTPNKEGSYRLTLVVNQGLTTEVSDSVIAAVPQLKTLERVPAAGETTEADATDGWAVAADGFLRRLDALLADSGLRVGVADATLAAGDVVRVVAATVIKVGLPGEETLPRFGAADATDAQIGDYTLGVVVSKVGGGSAAADELVIVRTAGLFGGLVGAPSVGDRVFVSDAGALALTAGTYTRGVGVVADVGATWTADLRTLGDNSSVASALNIVEPTASPYVVQTSDQVVLVNPSPPVAFAVTLPAGATHTTRRLYVKDKTGNASSTNVTITAGGGETIDGAASVTLASDFGAVTLVFNGTEWSIV